MASSTSTSATPLPPWKAAFLSSILTHRILHFGTFTLKSGRESPYFFNAGLLHRADLLSPIADAYAHTLLSYQHPPSASTSTSSTCAVGPPLDFDVLFGPAYKGIPLCISTLLALARLSPPTFQHVSYSFNRKEAKAHGEGGSIVGAALKGKRVVIVDDVITAGTAIREAVGIIEKEGGVVVGVVVALDRGERLGEAAGEQGSALASVRKTLGGGVPVLAVLTLEEVIEGLRGGVGGVGSQEEVERLEAYREKWRAID